MVCTHIDTTHDIMVNVKEPPSASASEFIWITLGSHVDLTCQIVGSMVAAWANTIPTE